ncbi:peptide upstream protein [Trifolium repens]|nr:peptide upstream protein [Trifolium repens]
MDSNSKSFKIHNPFGSLPRTMFYRILLLASAISIVSLLYSLPTMDFGSIAPKTYDHDCAVEFDQDHSNLTVTPGSYLFQSRILNTFWGSFDSLNCKKEINLVSTVVKKLMDKQLLWNSEAESLCIGEYSDIAVSSMKNLGFSNVINHRFISFNKKNFVYKLDHYREFSFDFVLLNDLEKVAVPGPALLVLEVERILKPNGIGALILTGDYSHNSVDMLRIASPISLLRFSSILHVGFVNNNHGLVVFQKSSESKIASEDKSSSLYHDDQLFSD